MTSNNIRRVVALATLIETEQFDPFPHMWEEGLEEFGLYINQNPDLAPVHGPPTYVEATTQPDLDRVVDTRAATPWMATPSGVDSRAATPSIMPDDNDEELTEDQEDLQTDELRTYETINDWPDGVAYLAYYAELSAPIRT